MGLVNYHDTTFSPAGLWNLNNDLTDASGNGFTLTIGAGTERYADISPGVRGLVLDGSTYAKLTSFNSTLGITGDLTIELLLNPGINTQPSVMVAHVGATSGGTSADNYLYQLQVSSFPLQKFSWENGTRSSQAYNIFDLPPQSGLFHWAVTRASNVVQFYLNGRAIGAASSALGAPAGGGTGTFKLGGDSTTEGAPSILASVKVIASALSAANVKAEYIKTLGGLYCT